MNEQNEKMPLGTDEDEPKTSGRVTDEEFENMIATLLSESRKQDSTKQEASEIVSLIRASQIVETTSDEEILSEIYARIQKGEITGDADDYHNTAVAYSRSQQPERASRICQTGLKKWPESIDLNADALTYALDAGMTDKLGALAADLEKNCPDRSRWNWRGFRFLLQYYIKLKPEGYEETVEKLIEDYKKYLPSDEGAYMSEYEQNQSLGKIDKAVQALEGAVAKLKAPQCALTLADIYFERADYKNAIRAATIGIAYAAETQPGIRTVHLLMLRALAKDADLLRNGEISSPEAEKILKEYELARKYASNREKKVIDLRMDILRTYASLSDK